MGRYIWNQFSAVVNTGKLLAAVFFARSGLREVRVVILDNVVLVSMAELAIERTLSSGRLAGRFRAAIFHRSLAACFIGLRLHVVSSGRHRLDDAQTSGCCLVAIIAG
jgi:hypothetical protein